MSTLHPTREKILDAVFKLIYINGYNGTSMSMILKECEIPKGSLYHFFKSKKEMALCVVKERIAPRMKKFFELEEKEGEDPIDTIIRAIERVAQKEDLVSNGCPLNRLNQEMSPVDPDFDQAIKAIYAGMKQQCITLLQNRKWSKDLEIESLAEYVIAAVWGALSLSPSESSTQRYLQTVSHLINYLQSLK